MSAQQQPPTKTILLFIDDLHIPFNETSRLRTGLKQVSEHLPAGGWVFALVSDGTSFAWIKPTNDAASLVSVANRIAGGGLKPEELVNRTPYVERDITRRYLEARQTLQDAVDAVHPDVVLFITEGELPGTGLTVPVVPVKPEAIDAAFVALLSAR